MSATRMVAGSSSGLFSPSSGSGADFGIAGGPVHRARGFVEAADRALDEVEDALGMVRFMIREARAHHGLNTEQLEDAVKAVDRLAADLINLGADVDAEQAALRFGLIAERALPARFTP